MVLSVFTYDNVDAGWSANSEGEVTIAKMAKEIFFAWPPDGIDGKTLVPALALIPESSNSEAASSK